MLLRKKEEIEAWLNQFQIKNYELIKDDEYGYIVNVNGDIDLRNKDLINISVKFNNIKGSFNCGYNQIISLEGSPEIIKGNFNCSFNNLTIEGLKYIPEIVNGNFISFANLFELNVSDFSDFNSFKQRIHEILNIETEQKLLIDLIKNKKEESIPNKKIIKI